MRVIGVDPGLRFCGYGVIEACGSGVEHIESGVIKPDPNMAHSDRLSCIFRGISDVIARSSPDCMSIEEVFYSKNPRSSLRLGEARGAAILAASVLSVPVFEYSPTQVKLVLSGKGRARKEDLEGVLANLLGVRFWARHDASDAVAIALCHFYISTAKGLFGEGATFSGRKRLRFTRNDFPSSR